MTAAPKTPLLAWLGRRMAMRALGGCLAVPFALCLVGACALASNILAEAGPGSDLETWAYLGFAAFLCAASVGLPATALGGAIWYRARQLDPIFTPLGLVGKPYILISRQYNGHVGGRAVSIRVTRGPLIIMTLSGTPGWEMAIGTRTALGQALAPAFASRRLPLDDPSLGHLATSSTYPEQARALLADGASREAILRATRDVGAMELRTLNVEPGGVRLSIQRMPLRLLTSASAQAWLDDLAVIVSTAERLAPAPTSPAAV